MTGDNPSGETFTATNARVLGVAAVTLGLVGVLVGLVGGSSVIWWLVALGVNFAALAWASMLRPVVAVRDDALVLRNMLDTVRIPLAAIEEVVVRQVLAVRAGDRRFTSPAVGMTRRQILRDDRGPRRGGSGGASADGAGPYGQFVETRIRVLAEEARARRGIALYSDEQVALSSEVRREPAVAEIVALAASALAFVVAVLV